MLDTCVLINFYLVYKKELKNQKIPNSLVKSQELLRLFEKATFQNIMTKWNKWELRQTIKNIWLQQKYILAGYSTREFNDARKEIRLEQQDLKKINDSVFDLWKFCVRETYELTEEDCRLIEKITKQGYDFIDLLLILQAKRLNCDFFVTKDNELRNLSDLFKINIIGINEFISKNL